MLYKIVHWLFLPVWSLFHRQWAKGARLEQLALPVGKDLASLSLYFLYSFLLVLGFPADLGGCDSPGAKTGWWQVWEPKQDVYEARFLTVWILACLRMCALPHTPLPKLLLWFTWNYFWFSLSWPVFGNVDTPLWLMVFVAEYFCRHFGMTAKNSKTKNGSQAYLAFSIWLYTYCFLQKENGREGKN